MCLPNAITSTGLRRWLRFCVDFVCVQMQVRMLQSKVQAVEVALGEQDDSIESVLCERPPASVYQELKMYTEALSDALVRVNPQHIL